MVLRKSILRLSTSLLCLVESFVFTEAVLAQQSDAQILKYVKVSEVGLGIGGLNYQGDIATGYRFANNRPAATVFYRKVVSQPLTLRAALTGGFFRASDEVYDDRPFQVVRDAEIRSRLLELGLGIEYYFLDHYDFRRLVRWSPYFFAHPSVMIFRTERESGPPNDPEEGKTDRGVRPSFAMGGGVKYALSRNWNIGLEYGARLVLSRDHLDDLTATTSEGRQLSNPHNRDWYIYNGLFVSYTFYKTPCPRVYRKNMEILN